MNDLDQEFPLGGTQSRVERAHILIVDDDALIRELLREMLAGEGYIVSEVDNGRSMFSVLEKKQVDLVTLDLTLGNEDGLALAREIRLKKNVPIIMISAKGSELDKVVGLELGADDYITKPFSVREVLARIRAVLRRYDGSPRNRPSSCGTQKFLFDSWVFGNRCYRPTSLSMAGVA
jgi:DNA-binding response OmpR family regulator